MGETLSADFPPPPEQMTIASKPGHTRHPDKGRLLPSCRVPASKEIQPGEQGRSWSLQGADHIQPSGKSSTSAQGYGYDAEGITRLTRYRAQLNAPHSGVKGIKILPTPTKKKKYKNLLFHKSKKKESHTNPWRKHRFPQRRWSCY